METQKIYYQDPHAASFTATVLCCRAVGTLWEVILDATAFYPLGGGQAADTGTLAGHRVVDVREDGDAIVHLCDGALTPGAVVSGTIDYPARFSRMQQHSGEHIVSGIINRRYGFHNTGFHMGADVMTIDFDGVIASEDLADIQREANAAVWRNLPIKCWYPSQAELPGIPYRSKKALQWPVRIVEIPGYDICACCGTHVSATGEIGLIQLLSTVSFRGGTRMEMACGEQALAILDGAFLQNKLVSQAFSAKPEETGAAARQMNEQLAALKYRLTGLEKELFSTIAGNYRDCGDVLHRRDGLDGNALRNFTEAIAAVCGGTAAVFSLSEGEGFSYCLMRRDGDLRSQGKAMVTALNGRGGGKPGCQMGRVHADWAQISAYFGK